MISELNIADTAQQGRAGEIRQICKGWSKGIMALSSCSLHTGPSPLDPDGAGRPAQMGAIISGTYLQDSYLSAIAFKNPVMVSLKPAA
ncbi:hypothetical protein FLX27_19990 [Agrobacterium tumefaciens]|nr:hypothetical protein [Agrobacterium tumefaciens]TQN59691.1 hypothetical protein FLX27_19990 [Agrobacterium tumefaciens]